MRKIRSRPPRFVAIDNKAVDDLRLSVLDVGLLAVALRCPDGAEFTVESTARKRKPGREALTGAMRNLVARGYVVKLKIQDDTSGQWRTEFSVADLPFTPQDVVELLDDIRGVRAVRVEPDWLDPRDDALAPPSRSTRPTGTRHSGATSRNVRKPQVAPTDGFPTVGKPTVGFPTAGQPTVGKPSAKRRRLEVQDSLSCAGTSADSATGSQKDRAEEREIAAPPQPGTPAARHAERTDLPSPAPPTAAADNHTVREAAVRVAEGWAAARTQRGYPVPVRGKSRVARAAVDLLTEGTSETVLRQAAADMARQAAWLDLARHLEHWTPPVPAQARRAAGPVQYCGDCDFGWLEAQGRVRKCPCRTQPLVQGLPVLEDADRALPVAQPSTAPAHHQE